MRKMAEKFDRLEVRLKDDSFLPKRMSEKRLAIKTMQG